MHLVSLSPEDQRVWLHFILRTNTSSFRSSGGYIWISGMSLKFRLTMHEVSHFSWSFLYLFIYFFIYSLHLRKNILLRALGEITSSSWQGIEPGPSLISESKPRPLESSGRKTEMGHDCLACVKDNRDHQK